MDRKKFAVIKYDHGERVGLSTARKFWLAVIGVLALGLLVAFPHFFPLLLPLGLAAVMIAQPPKELYVGPRYIICGNKILYYANIQKVILEHDVGQLTLESSTGQVLMLDQYRFQSNARKLDKIAAHKEARFNKVARKIVDRVQRASPDAELKGVLKLLATGT
jgi:hypothetical protein